MNRYYRSFICTLTCAACLLVLGAPGAPSPLAAGNNAAVKTAQQKSTEERAGKAFRAQFFSLKRGNSIAPASMILYDRGAMEIKVEHEALVTSRAAFTVDGVLFTADWEFTITREKPYRYVCRFSGIHLFDTYIAGLLTLKEYIDTATLTQELPFIFFATAADKNSL